LAEGFMNSRCSQTKSEDQSEIKSERMGSDDE